MKHYREQFEPDDEVTVVRVTYEATVSLVVRHGRFTKLDNHGRSNPGNGAAEYSELLDDVKRFHHPELHLAGIEPGTFDRVLVFPTRVVLEPSIMTSEWVLETSEKP